MKPLERRLQSLEASSDSGLHRLALDRLSTPDLERLEQIIIAMDAGTLTIATMCEEDLAIVASIRIEGEDGPDGIMSGPKKGG